MLLYSLVVSYVLAKAIDLVMGFRIGEDEEVAGIDQAAHAETAYDFTGAGGGTVGRLGEALTKKVNA